MADRRDRGNRSGARTIVASIRSRSWVVHPPVPARSGSQRTRAVAPDARPWALTAVVFDLDEQDVEELDVGALDDDELDEDGVETIDEAWLEPVDETVMELLPEDTAAGRVAPSRYPPGLADDEVEVIVGVLTTELCRRGSRRGRHGFGAAIP